MKSWNRSVTVALAASAISVVGGLSAGCGGGGGGGGGNTPPPTTYTIQGLLLNNGAALSGVAIRFDGIAGFAATTAANGAFTLTVPKTAITGTDFAAVYFPAGAAPVKQTITETAGVPQNLGTFDIHVITVPTYVIHGKLVNNGVALPGVTVKFNDLAIYTSVTDASGNFVLTIPKTATTGNDFASIYFATTPAHKAIVETNGVPSDIGTIDVGLPPPPPI